MLCTQSIGDTISGLDSAQLTQEFVQAMGYHCPSPAALGARAGSLPNKLGAFLHSLKLETRSAQALDSMVSHMISLTTDLGTEFGLADSPGAGWWDHFEKSCKPSVMLADGVEADWGDEAMDDACERPFLFKQCIPIAGMLHVFDNMAKDLLAAVQY